MATRPFNAATSPEVLAGVLVYDGLCGSRSAMNLAGVLPWIHWRGLVVLGLLVAGNVFCMACPFTLPRALPGDGSRAICLAAWLGANGWP